MSVLFGVQAFGAAFPEVGCWVNYNGMFGAKGSGFIHVRRAYDNTHEVEYLSPRNDMGIGFSPRKKSEIWFCTAVNSGSKNLKVCIENLKYPECRFVFDSDQKKLYRNCNNNTALEKDGDGKQSYFETLGCTSDAAVLECAEQYYLSIGTKTKLNPQCTGIASRGLFRPVASKPKPSACLQAIDSLVEVGKTAGGAMGISNDPDLKARQEARIANAKASLGKQCKSVKPSVEELIKVAVSVGKVEAISSDPALHQRQDKRAADQRAIVLKDYGIQE